MLRCISFAGVDFKLHILALLIANFERSTIRRHHFYFQLAVGAIELGIGRVIGQAVLVTDVARDVVKNLWVLRRKTRLIKAPPRHPGKSLHFVVGLQIVHLVGGYGQPAGIAGPSMLVCLDFTRFPQDPTYTDRKDRYVFSILDLLQTLIKIEFAETVKSSADEDDVFVAFNSVQPVKRVIESVEHVGLGEPGNAQLV